MRNFKRFLTLALAVMMVVSMFAFGTSAAKFTDVDENNEYLAKAVNLLNYVGVVKGISETEFGTDELVTREQMAAFIYRLMKKGQSVEGGNNSSTFTDLEDPTFFFMVSWASRQNIIKGTSATTFDPKGSITLQDAYTMIVRALGYEEENELAYPFGYIDVAEADGVELDEGLASTVTYTDALTRGDVAIILYNAFFAETGVPETTQVEEEIGTGANATWVLKTETTYPTLCEKVFDVLEVEYQAVATENYVFGDNSTTKDLGFDAIQFAYADEKVKAPAEFYASMEDLGIEGKSDDYILSHFTLYITLDDDDENKVEKILYAEPLMTKKNVSEIKLETLSSTNKKAYYSAEYDADLVPVDEDAISDAKRLSGKVLLDGEAAYFFNAPYAYAKPAYKTGMLDSQKYAARNADNLLFIDRALIDDDVDAGEYVISVDYDAFYRNDNMPVYVDDGNGGWEIEDPATTTSYYETDSVALVEALKQVYTGGLYEAVVYDVDGDGIYDYIEYMPYTAAFVDTDEDEDFFTSTLPNASQDEPTLYTNEAVIEGEKFENGDFVIAYLDKDANYIKVAAVVESVKAAIDDIDPDNGKVKLDNGETVSAKDGWKAVALYGDTINLAEVGYDLKEIDTWAMADLEVDGYASLGEEAEFWYFGGAILFQDGIDNRVVLNSDLIIITEDEKNEMYPESSFSPTSGKTQYAYAWVDGELKYVAIDLDSEIYATDANDDYILLDDSVETYKNVVATYTVNSKGLYTVKLLGNAYEEDGVEEGTSNPIYKYIGIDHEDDLTGDDTLANKEDATIQAWNALEGSYNLVKGIGRRFKLTADGSTTNVLPYEFVISDDTTIIIRNEYNGEVKFYAVDAAKLDESIKVELTNVQYVVANNTKYETRENLLLLFAEVNGEKFKTEATKGGSKSDRIVSSQTFKLNADKDFYAEYVLMNPYTGETETVTGTAVETKSSYIDTYARGDIIEVTASGLVDDDTFEAAKGTFGANYWVIDYDADNKVLEVVADLGDINTSLASSNPRYFIDVENATASQFTNRTNGSGESMYKWGADFGVANMADLGSEKDALRHSMTYYDAKGKSSTIYAKNINVYLDIEWENDADHDELNDDNNTNGSVDYVVVVALINETQGNYEEYDA